MGSVIDFYVRLSRAVESLARSTESALNVGSAITRKPSRQAYCASFPSAPLRLEGYTRVSEPLEETPHPRQRSIQIVDRAVAEPADFEAEPPPARSRK